MSEQTTESKTALQLKMEWNTKALKNLVSAVDATNSTNLNFHFTQDGLKVNTLKAGDTSAVLASFPKSFFKEYQGYDLDVSIKIGEIKNILRRFDEKKIEFIKIYDGGNSRFVFEGGEKKFANRIEACKDPYREQDISKVPTTATIQTSQASMKELMEDAKIGDSGEYDKTYLQLTVKNGIFSVNRYTSVTTFERDIPNSEEWKIEGEVEPVLYQVELLRTMVNSTGKSDKITLKLGDNMPALMLFDDGEICAIAAPYAVEK